MKTIIRGANACALAALAIFTGEALSVQGADTESRVPTSPEFFNRKFTETPPPAAPPSGSLIYGVNRQVVPAEKPSVTLHLEFQFDSDQFAEIRSVFDLAGLGFALNGDLLNPYSFKIVGHTDTRGTPEHNQRLSEARASMVKYLLVKYFRVDEKRLAVEGRGMREPIAMGNTEADHQMNRRVVITRMN